MAMKFSGILLVSDIDGTLVEAPASIPPRNIAAAQRFTERGGRFAIATGRSVLSTKQFVDQLPVNGTILSMSVRRSPLWARLCWMKETCFRSLQ